MATLALTRLWLNLASDTSQALDLPLRGVEHAPQVASRTDSYAAGNFRVISRPGRQQQSRVTLGFLTDEQVSVLRDWHGQVVCARFPDGAKFYATYVDPSFNPRPGPVGTPTTLSLTEVTVSEVV